MKMTMDKAIAALITNLVGLPVTFAWLTEPQSQAVGGVLTGIATVAAVYGFPNRSK